MYKLTGSGGYRGLENVNFPIIVKSAYIAFDTVYIAGGELLKHGAKAGVIFSHISYPFHAGSEAIKIDGD